MENYQYPIIAINRDTSTLILESENGVLDFIRKHGEFGEKFDFYPYSYSWVERFIRPIKIGDWILRDNRGKVVHYKDFYGKIYFYKPNKKRLYQEKQRRVAIERGLPIPYIRHSKPWRNNAPAKKNSGNRKRNVLRSLAQEHEKEYGIRNKYGKVQRFEGW